MDLPYIGSYQSIHQPNSSPLWYGGDTEKHYQEYLANHQLQQIPENFRVDGSWHYTFNSKGYRGDEYDKNADMNLAIVGCSLGFGEGVRWEQTWGYQLKLALEQQTHYRNVNYLNFSQSGASNDYITRTALRQCNHIKPTFLICYFTHAARKEIIDKESVYSYGSWCATENDYFKGLLSCYTEQEAIANTLKNLILLQQFCKLQSISYYFILQERVSYERAKISEHPVLGVFWKMIDWNRIANYRISWKDLARDNRHPGPLSHQILSQQIYESAAPHL